MMRDDNASFIVKDVMTTDITLCPITFDVKLNAQCDKPSL